MVEFHPPRDESCVIAAHNYWLGRHKYGTFSPRWLAISSHTTIDGLRLSEAVNDDTIAVYDNQKNATVSDGQCAKVEYKHDSKALVSQNNNMKQMFKYYDVGVCWTSLRKLPTGYSAKWKKLNGDSEWPMHSQCWLYEPGSEGIGIGQSGIYVTSLEIIYNLELRRRVTERITEISGTDSDEVKIELKSLNRILRTTKTRLGLHPDAGNLD